MLNFPLSGTFYKGPIMKKIRLKTKEELLASGWVESPANGYLIKDNCIEVNAGMIDLLGQKYIGSNYTFEEECYVTEETESTEYTLTTGVSLSNELEAMQAMTTCLEGFADVEIRRRMLDYICSRFIKG